MSEDDIDAIAGEYVLGTLDLAERRAVAARRRAEPALDAAILAWERRLSPLDALAPETPPPAGLWERIVAEIAEAPATADIVALARRLRRWRAAALVSGLAAAAALVVAVTGVLAPPPPSRFVAVLARDAASPAFLVEVDIRSRALTIRPVEATTPAGKSYELWLVNARYPGPRSLGVIAGDGAQSTSARLSGYPDEVVRSSVLAVSLEPEGGSPTGAPTGPVVFTGKLVATAL